MGNDDKKYGTMNYSEYIPESPPDICCCGLLYKGFFQSDSIYNQSCTNCGSQFFINSERHRKLIVLNNNPNNSNNSNNSNNLTDVYEQSGNNFYKNYRTSQCLKCNKIFESNWKDKYYFAWGLFCYKVVNRYDKLI